MGAEDDLSDIDDILQLDDTTQQAQKRSADSFLSKNKIKKNASEELMFDQHVSNEMRMITDSRTRQSSLYVKLQIQNSLFEAVCEP